MLMLSMILHGLTTAMIVIFLSHQFIWLLSFITRHKHHHLPNCFRTVIIHE
uniref:Uncharacterized protein n=1 Tax=Rhizophora mucronata TaxID=61149 RepID=A0A2P2QD40_RHIMU